jgi:PKD repeat protein
MIFFLNILNFNLKKTHKEGDYMNIKQKMPFILIFMVILSGTTLAASTTDTNAKTLLKAPASAFTSSSTSGYTSLKVAFTDKSTGSPTSWNWNFGDGTSSKARNPVHTYSKVGKYTVTLTVKNSKGSSKITKNNYITVLAPLKVPVAAFTASTISGYAPLKVTFTDRSTGTPTSWNWNFGDGTSSKEKNPVHTYSKVGKYTVTLTVKNSKGSSKPAKNNLITVNSAMVVDVVCKMVIDKRTAEYKSVYKGITYYFCMADCKNKFDNNPGKYIIS